jgi:hypothetical protein
MPMLRDILTWLAILIPIMLNTKMQEMPFVQEVRITPHTEHISQAVAVILIAVPHLSVQIAVVNVWAAIS